MNVLLELQIVDAGRALADAIEAGAANARELQAAHRALLAQRTPADHAEMALAKGLPVAEGAAHA